jgi:hypothetical protein
LINRRQERPFDHTKFGQEIPRVIHRRCDHKLALVIDPTDRELNELEQMLANRPNCSRWSPGDGPIMAVVVSAGNTRNEEPNTLV